ncbi:MAG: aminoacyl-tRNA hydrolase [bacterium]|nr:aminoacyl-tRNA hydrolase [bacterium]
MQRPKLIIGLGNPGEEYADTYHNVGYIFADRFNKKRDEKGMINIRIAIRSDKNAMNNSGKFVVWAMQKYEATKDEILIAHDDSDLELGTYKFSPDSGSAGHKGVQNIIDILDTPSFWRLRIGIRPKPRTGSIRQKAETFVLKKISAANKKLILDACDKAIQEIFYLPL